MTTGWFQGRRLEYNDMVTYRSAIVAAVNPEAPPQPEGDRPYIGHIVDFTDTAIGVRADGWWGEAPLYYVLTGAILSVEPYVAPRSTAEDRGRARLARRERDGTVPEPDTPEALVAALADWGAEYRPHKPCAACGCTLYWTAAGALMCAQCLPMSRLTEQSRERIARLFPRKSVKRDPLRESAVDAWKNPPPKHERCLRKDHKGRSL